jgi:hypothetical protein
VCTASNAFLKATIRMRRYTIANRVVLSTVRHIPSWAPTIETCSDPTQPTELNTSR